MAADDYKWWRERLAQALRLADAVRIDHFRGFEAFWAVPAGEETAERGNGSKARAPPSSRLSKNTSAACR
jgi:4-alpha-glucanotransferase